jgi:hypothetical protein
MNAAVFALKIRLRLVVWRQGMALCMQLQLVGWAAPPTGDSISAYSEILSRDIQKEITCVDLIFTKEKL